MGPCGPTWAHDAYKFGASRAALPPGARNPQKSAFLVIFSAIQHCYKRFRKIYGTGVRGFIYNLYKINQN